MVQPRGWHTHKVGQGTNKIASHHASLRSRALWESSMRRGGPGVRGHRRRDRAEREAPQTSDGDVLSEISVFPTQALSSINP